MVEVTVARLGLDSATNSYVVILREKHGKRLLPIWIGHAEAESIAMEMNQMKRERPYTHDLCKALIVGLGGTLRRVNITRVQKSTYFAELQIEGPVGVVEFDARPSDSIAIALRLRAPIYAQDTLLSDIDTDDSDADDTDLDLTPGESPGMNAEELKKYLGNLRPEDFGKFNP